MIDPILQKAAIGQTCQRVVGCLVFKLLLMPLTVCNVIYDANEMGDFSIRALNRGNFQLVPELTTIFTVVANFNVHFHFVIQSSRDFKKSSLVFIVASQKPRI